MHYILKTFYSPMFFPLIFQFHLRRLDCFRFLSVNDQPYPTFLFHLDILLFDVPLALLLVGTMSLCILNVNSIEWGTRKFWSRCILLEAWLGRDIFGELRFSLRWELRFSSYNILGEAFDIGHTVCWIFRYFFYGSIHIFRSRC